MRLRPVSWNGNSITAAAGYGGVIPIDVPLTPGVDIIESAVWQDYPHYGGKALRSHYLSILFDVADDTHYNQIAEWFYAGDDHLYTLVAQDEADGNRQWQIEATAREIPKRAGNKVIVNLYAPNPLWRQTALQTTAWNLTASGQQKTVSVIGNRPTAPVIRLTPVTPKVGGYAKRMWRPYYNVMVTPIPEYWFLLATIDTAALVADATKSNQVNQSGGITAVATSIPIDTAVGGGLSASGGICYVGTEQIKYDSISAGVMTVSSGGRGWGGTTAAVHADNDVIKQSRILANGYDMRVYIGQTEWVRWLDGMNTSATKIWVTLPAHGAKQEVTLSGSIANSGPVSTIQFKTTAANKTALGKMKAPCLLQSANGEAFYCATIDAAKYNVGGVTRQARDTAIQSHADGTILRYIELDIQILYSNPNASNPAYSDEKKPIVDLNASSNTSWLMNEFYAAGGLRGGWKPNRISSLGKVSDWYTGPQGADADPATEMGAAFFAYLLANVWKAETASIEWALYQPVGVTAVTVTGQKRRESTTWPATMAFQKSATGKTWANVWNEATPASLGAWVAFTSHSGVALSGTFQYLRFFINGSIGAVANNAIYHEVQSITLTLASGNVPGGSLQAAVDNYYLDGVFTNMATGDALGIALSMAVGETITIDCENKTAVRGDGAPIEDALSWNSKRNAWFDLQKGSNILQFDDAGSTSLAIAIDHRAKMAG
jgi:hypothetical protein